MKNTYVEATVAEMYNGWINIKLKGKILNAQSVLCSLYVNHYTGLQKNIPRMSFQYSLSFSPAEYEYESHFFPSRPAFPKFYDKGPRINKIGCL